MTRREAIEWQERLFPTTVWIREDDRSYSRQVCPTLPEICLDLRMALNGAADPWKDEEVCEVRDMLQARLATWDVPTEAKDYTMRHFNNAIDNAVELMVVSTVRMANLYLEEQKRG